MEEKEESVEITDEAQKNLLLLELILRLGALESLMIKKNLTTKEELLEEVEALTKRATEATMSILNAKPDK